MPGEAYELSLARLSQKRREIREPMSEQEDLMLQYIEHLARQKTPLVMHFTADVVYVKPISFELPSTIFSEGLHLPESRIVGSIHVENYCSIAQLQIIFGPNSSQGPTNYLVVNPKTWRRYPMPSGITSINLISDADDQGQATVILTTEIWEPNMGQLV